MARNLLKSGAFKEVYVWNRSADKCAELVAEGAKTAGSAAEVVAACDITFACLSDPAAALACVQAPGGVLDGISAGKVGANNRCIGLSPGRNAGRCLLATRCAWPMLALLTMGGSLAGRRLMWTCPPWTRPPPRASASW